MSMMVMLLQDVTPLPPPQNLPTASPETVTAAVAANQVTYGSLYNNQNLILMAVILVFGLLALGLLYLIVCRNHREPFENHLEPFELRIFTITVLVFGSLLVAAAGFNKDQLTPLIGFFGTIAGYILGRGELLDERTKNPRRDAHPEERK